MVCGQDNKGPFLYKTLIKLGVDSYTLIHLKGRERGQAVIPCTTQQLHESLTAF